MIVTLEQLLTVAALADAREARRLERKAGRTGVRPVPLTAQDRADALVAKREAREDQGRRRTARLRLADAKRAVGKHRKARR